MAGGPVILPVDPWERSDVTEEKLQSLVEAGLLRPMWQNLLNYRAHIHLSLSNDL